MDLFHQEFPHMKFATLSLVAVLAAAPLLAAQPPAQLVPPVVTPGAPRIETYYSPTPDAVVSGSAVYSAPIYSAPPVPLFTNVRYRQERKIAACAKPMIVEAPNPCYDPCNPCTSKCVLVEICAPPCETPCVEVRRNGDKLTYNFRDGHAVNVIVRRDHLVVDYDR
jgi:hypothetical protein